MTNPPLNAVPAAAVNAPAVPARAPIAGAPARPVPRAEPPPLPQPAVNPDAGREALAGAVKRIREMLTTTTAAVEFSVDDASGRTVLRVLDGQTKELIRQIPSDEVLAIAREIDRVQGLLLRERA